MWFFMHSPLDAFSMYSCFGSLTILDGCTSCNGNIHIAPIQASIQRRDNAANLLWNIHEYRSHWLNACMCALIINENGASFSVPNLVAIMNTNRNIFCWNFFALFVLYGCIVLRAYLLRFYFSSFDFGAMKSIGWRFCVCLAQWMKLCVCAKCSIMYKYLRIRSA